MLKTITEVAPTLADLKKLSLEQQSLLLLARFETIWPQTRSAGGLNKHNLLMQGDPYGLGAGYDSGENLAVRRYLLGAPWTELVNRGYLVDPAGHGFYEVSDEGQEALKGMSTQRPSRSALNAVDLLDPSLHSAQQDFRSGKFKEAVAAAFRRVENRLNEVRDASSNGALAGKNGVGLPYALYDSGVLKLPFPDLGAGDPRKREAYAKSLSNLMSGAIGFIRNAFDHEPHNLPNPDERSALELLFFASYLLRMVGQP